MLQGTNGKSHGVDQTELLRNLFRNNAHSKHEALKTA